MQTPLMELIEYFKKYEEVLGVTANLGIEKATELLEKERATIEQAYYNGISYKGASSFMRKDAQDYFTKTFTDESK